MSKHYWAAVVSQTPGNISRDVGNASAEVMDRTGHIDIFASSVKTRGKSLAWCEEQSINVSINALFLQLCQRFCESAHTASLSGHAPHIVDKTPANNEELRDGGFLYLNWNSCSLTASKSAFRCDRWYLDNLPLPCFLRTVLMWLVSLFALQLLIHVCWLERVVFLAVLKQQSAPMTGNRPFLKMWKEQSQLQCYANTSHTERILKAVIAFTIHLHFYFSNWSCISNEHVVMPL